MGRKMILSLVMVLCAMAGTAFYTFWTLDRVKGGLETVNKFYVPVLKNLNLLQGQWSAYERSFDQSVGFKKWGRKASENSYAVVGGPKLHLKKMVEPNLEGLNKLLERSSDAAPAELRGEISKLLELFSDLLVKENGRLAQIAGHVQNRRFQEAANLYSVTKQEHLNATQILGLLSQNLENRLSLLQFSSEQELRNSEVIFLLIFALCFVFTGVALLLVRRWLGPLAELTHVAQEISLKGIGGSQAFPKFDPSMPPEMGLLTREFSRMGLTVLERERTINQQKIKLEGLNQNLKDQNEILRRLGSLNERVLNSMSTGILVVGEEGIVDQYNNRYCDLFEVDRADLIGQDAAGVLKKWPQESVKTWLECQDSFHAPRLSFGDRIFDVRVQQLQEQAGRLVLFEDVTEIVHAQARLEHARKIMLAGNMSAQVAHEVRNPLNSIHLQLEMLEEDLRALELASDDRKEAGIRRVVTILDQVQRLERMTQKYLEVHKPHQREHVLVDMNELIEKCLEFLSGEIQAAGIQVRLNLQAKNKQVRGDADSLLQVLFNLVRNSIEAVRSQKSGAREIVLSTSDDGAGLSVKISDSGGGVSSEIESRLFEPFVTNKVFGHGLGLSLSRQICLDHGGDLKFLGGASFEVILRDKTT